MKLITKELKKQIPGLYSTENIDVSEKIAYIKYFHPLSSWNWYAVEFDGEDLFFGFVDGDYPEWGYFSLSELQSINIRGLGIERDLYFDEKTLSEVRRKI